MVRLLQLMGLLLAPRVTGFSSHPQQHRVLQSITAPATVRSPLFRRLDDDTDSLRSSKFAFVRRLANRFNPDTLDAANIHNALTAGAGSSKGSSGAKGSGGGIKFKDVIQKIKDTHNPITYGILLLGLGFKYQLLFRNRFYWLALAFCVKWYRARYVFKIPVWDRQPNWNNIITSKEQEKDLKALTCRNCGSTLFIAKTREFYFEGRTGIADLGCFSCGAKGKDNFYEDRENIVENVGDMDDYFEYERPLEFVDRAERRRLLKEAGGDEAKANELAAKESGAGDGGSDEKPKKKKKKKKGTKKFKKTSEDGEAPKKKEDGEAPKKKKKKKKSAPTANGDSVVSETLKKESKPALPKPKKPAADDDFLDSLGMDDY